MIDWHDVLKVAAGFLAGFSVKWYMVWRSSRTTTTQNKNVVGGNLAGRDVNIGNRKP
jgi:hypothetical protein